MIRHISSKGGVGVPEGQIMSDDEPTCMHLP